MTAGAAHPRHRHRDDAGRRRARARRTARSSTAPTWPAGYRHGETLLPAIERLLGEPGVDAVATRRRSSSGPGPGAFTGLRVGIATAKGLAHGLGRPIVGVSTGEALLAAAAADRRRGRPARRCCCRPARPTGSSCDPARRPRCCRPAPTRRSRRRDRWSPWTSTAARPTTRCERGERGARRARPPSCSRIGRRAARAPATPTTSRALVPEYVTLPRGAVRAERGGGVVARPPVRLPHRADAARGPRRPSTPSSGRASTRRGRPTPTAASSRRTAWRTTSSPAPTTRSSATAACG